MCVGGLILYGLGFSMESSIKGTSAVWKVGSRHPDATDYRTFPTDKGAGTC